MTFAALVRAAADYDAEIALLLRGSSQIAYLPRDPHREEIRISVDRTTIDDLFAEAETHWVSYSNARDAAEGVLTVGDMPLLVTLPPISQPRAWGTIHIGMASPAAWERYLDDRNYLLYLVQSRRVLPDEADRTLLWAYVGRNHTPAALVCERIGERLGIQCAPIDPDDVLAWRETHTKAAEIRRILLGRNESVGGHDDASLLLAAVQLLDDHLRGGTLSPNLQRKRDRYAADLEAERERVSAWAARAAGIGQQRYDANSFELALTILRQACLSFLNDDCEPDRIVLAVHAVIDAVPCDPGVRAKLEAQKSAFAYPANEIGKNGEFGRAVLAAVLNAALSVQLACSGTPYEIAMRDAIKRLYAHYDEVKFGGDFAL